MSRKVFPSMRTRLVSRCGLPVQCVVSRSVNLSACDQMLKYGSTATRGTAGGANFPGTLSRGFNEAAEAKSARENVKTNAATSFMVPLYPAEGPAATTLWWKWSRCDHSARVQRAAATDRQSRPHDSSRHWTRRDSSQRDEFHLTFTAHRVRIDSPLIRYRQASSPPRGRRSSVR